MQRLIVFTLPVIVTFTLPVNRLSHCLPQWPVHCLPLIAADDLVHLMGSSLTPLDSFLTNLSLVGGLDKESCSWSGCGDA